MGENSSKNTNMERYHYNLLVDMTKATVYFKTFKVILRNFLCSLEITNPIKMMDNTIIKSDCTWGDVIVLIQA